MTERAGSVIEVVHIEGYEINVKGLIINKTNEYPEALVTQLKDLFTTGNSINMRCAATDIWLQEMGFNVVVKSLSIPENRGVQNVVPYELSFINDSILDLEEI